MNASITIHIETLWTNRAELNVKAELNNPPQEKVIAASSLSPDV